MFHSGLKADLSDIFKLVIPKVSNSLEVVKVQFPNMQIRTWDLWTLCPLKVVVVSRMAHPVFSWCSNQWKTTVPQSPHEEQLYGAHVGNFHPFFIQRPYKELVYSPVLRCLLWLLALFFRAVFNSSYLSLEACFQSLFHKIGHLLMYWGSKNAEQSLVQGQKYSHIMWISLLFAVGKC